MVKKLWYIHIMESSEAVKKIKVCVLNGELISDKSKRHGAGYVCSELCRQFLEGHLRKW